MHPLAGDESASRMLDEAESKRLRRRLINRLSWILAMTSLGGLGAGLLLAPVEPVSTILMSVFASGFLLVPWVGRRMASPEPAAILLVALLLGLLVSISYVAGGLDAPILALLPVVAAVAVPVLGGRRGWIAVVGIVAVIVWFLYLHVGGHPFAEPLTASGFRQSRALMLVIASALLAGIVMMYERQNRRFRRELRSQASRDPLTGLANRRYAAAALAYEWARANRAGSPMSVILFDVDHFKKYNDSLGHQAGDECLREIADLSRSTIRRATDLVARYGGEEFLAVLPATDHADAMRVAEELRATLERQAITHPAAQSGVVTVSFGVATAVDVGSMSSDELIQQADEALYRAKASGRNRVEGWSQAAAA
jgi:diguanylate cyclase (GGDEF)-like protein